MTEALENIPTMTATQRLIEVLRSEQRGMWSKVDATFEAVNEHDDASRARDAYEAQGSTNTGLHIRITEVWEELFNAHVPDQPEIKTVARWYGAARAWPEETRVEGASFRAHLELAGDQWRDRQGILSKLVAKKRKYHDDESMVTSGDDVRLWKQSQKPQPEFTPWDEKFYGRLDSLIHSRVGPKTKTEWQSAIALVKQLLDEMREEAENAE